MIACSHEPPPLRPAPVASVDRLGAGLSGQAREDRRSLFGGRQRRHPGPHPRAEARRRDEAALRRGEPSGRERGIGTDFVAKSAGDGYTLLVTASGPLTVNPTLYKG